VEAHRGAVLSGRWSFDGSAMVTGEKEFSCLACTCAFCYVTRKIKDLAVLSKPVKIQSIRLWYTCRWMKFSR